MFKRAILSLEEELSEGFGALAKEFGKGVASDVAKKIPLATAAVGIYQGKKATDRLIAKKRFKDTVTGQEEYARMKSLADRYKALKAQQQSMPTAEFRIKAKKMESAIVTLRNNIHKKEAEYNF